VHALLARTGERKARRLKTKTTPFSDLILHAPQFFTSLTFALEDKIDLQKRRAENLLKPLLKTDFAKSLLCQKKRTWQKKPEPNLPKLLLKNVADFRNLTLPNKTQAMKNGLCQMKPLACQNLN